MLIVSLFSFKYKSLLNRAANSWCYLVSSNLTNANHLMSLWFLALGIDTNAIVPNSVSELKLLIFSLKNSSSLEAVPIRSPLNGPFRTPMSFVCV